MDRVVQFVSGAASEKDPAHAIWQDLNHESVQFHQESFLGSSLSRFIQNESTLESALAGLIARKLASAEVPPSVLVPVFRRAFANDDSLIRNSIADLRAFVSRDPACTSLLTAFMFLKGFHALLGHRVAHKLWIKGDRMSAYWVQNRCSALFGVDIHPAATLGSGIFIDHATGIVIGETAVVGNGVSLLHGVTLGGTGKEAGDRHPKIGNNVTISANATVLGNINVGSGAKIGACSVVLRDVPANSTVVGNPADIVRKDSARSVHAPAPSY